MTSWWMDWKRRQVYEKINSQLSSKWNGDIYVKSFYVLGRVAEQQGDRVKAVEQYRKFLNLWKDADPGIAEVEDAKKSLAGLKATLLPSCYCLKSKRKCVRGQ